MPTVQGAETARNIRQKMEELKGMCKGLDEDTASRAPAGRWSPKEILSHLCGPEGTGHLPIFQAFLTGKQDVDLHPGNPFFTDRRKRMTVSEYLPEVEREYEGIARFVENLSEEQLSRTARVPALKDSPLGEYPTLEDMVKGVAEWHLQFHLDHLRDILNELKAA